MSDHEIDAVQKGHSSWPTIRAALLIGFGILIGATAVWLAHMPPIKDSERYYPIRISIKRAEMLALILHLKSSDRNHPALVAGVHGWGEDDLKDGWGQPFRCAAVASPRGVDPDIYVWTDWVHDDGRITLIGARVSADGKVTRFGGPPRD